MDPKQIVMLALQVSIFCTVMGYGLKTTSGDLLYLLRRPGLLVRSLVAVLVFMPVVAVVLTRSFTFTRVVEIALIALAISPLPPLLPGKQIKHGGEAGYGVGLMALLALISIVSVPATLELFARFSGQQFSLPPSAVAQVVLQGVLFPLAVGVVIRAVLPGIAGRLEKPIGLVGKVLLAFGALLLLWAVFPGMKELIGDGTLFAMVIFIVAGLVIGHLLGGPDPENSVVLALATASRHPAIALAIASANFPDQRFGAAIVLYLLVNAIVGIPYLKWRQRSRAVVAVREA